MSSVPSPSSRPSACPPRSQLRSLVGDLAGLLIQQMFYWGCDARYPAGSLLVRLGAERIARASQGGEGSSRYRFDWQEGIVELHSFCAGWYPRDAAPTGIIFIRARERFFEFAGASPLTPGHYEEGRFQRATADEMLVLCRPLLSWLAEYERRVGMAAHPGYRERCFQAYRQHPLARAWLPPVESAWWLEQWLTAPEQTPRAKAVQRLL